MATEFIATPLREVNPAAQQFVTRASDGRAAKALQLERLSVLEDLRAQGSIRTATIVNFNPVWLRTPSAIPDSVPPYNWSALPEDMRVVVEHRGQKFVGSYLTITEPYLYPWPRGTRRDDGTGDDVLDCNIEHVLPLGRVLDLWMHYNKSSELPTGMGGILVYEGDRRLLDKRPDSLKFPVAKPLANGKRSYYSVETDLSDLLQKVFEQQRMYTSFAVQQARAFHADELQRKDITEQGHRVWGHYAHEKGWGVESLEDWMLANPNHNVSRCENCGAARKETKAWFCQACSAPYDPYAAFMAGKKVDEQWLYGLDGDKLDDVKREMKRRRSLFADDNDEPKSRKKPQ